MYEIRERVSVDKVRQKFNLRNFGWKIKFDLMALIEEVVVDLVSRLFSLISYSSSRPLANICVLSLVHLHRKQYTPKRSCFNISDWKYRY